MNETDFSQCRFIKEAMWFYTYDDFVKSRYTIKRLFRTLDKDGKLFYKYYVYANIHMNETFKNAIWDYLNGYDKHGTDLVNKLRIYKAR